jgi:hypothetical protein
MVITAHTGGTKKFPCVCKKFGKCDPLWNFPNFLVTPVEIGATLFVRLLTSEQKTAQQPVYKGRQFVLLNPVNCVQILLEGPFVRSLGSLHID